MINTIDINCDLGEGIGNEKELMPYISSCSIACGGHAGNAETIHEIIQLAQKHQVKIGAHPSFPDRANFGRVVMDLPLPQLKKSIEDQLQLFKNVAENVGAMIHHVKAHGALYNSAAVNPAFAEVVIESVKDVLPNVYLYVPYQSILHKLALKSNLKVKVEAFADRNYQEDLTLVSRKSENAIITNKEKLVTHLLRIITEEKVKTVGGAEVHLEAETYCFHGDHPEAVSLLKYASEMLQKKGIKIT